MDDARAFVEGALRLARHLFRRHRRRIVGRVGENPVERRLRRPSPCSFSVRFDGEEQRPRRRPAGRRLRSPGRSRRRSARESHIAFSSLRRSRASGRAGPRRPLSPRPATTTPLTGARTAPSACRPEPRRLIGPIDDPPAWPLEVEPQVVTDAHVSGAEDDPVARNANSGIGVRHEAASPASRHRPRRSIRALACERRRDIRRRRPRDAAAKRANPRLGAAGPPRSTNRSAASAIAVGLGRADERFGPMKSVVAFPSMKSCRRRAPSRRPRLVVTPATNVASRARTSRSVASSRSAPKAMIFAMRES